VRVRGVKRTWGETPRSASTRSVLAYRVCTFNTPPPSSPPPPRYLYDVGSIPGETYGGLMVIFCCHAVVFPS